MRLFYCPQPISARLCLRGELDRFFDAFRDAVGIESVRRKQDLRVAMGHDLIRDTHSNNFYLVLHAVRFEKLKYCRAEASGQISLFDRNDQLEVARQPEDRFIVEWFDEPGVDDGC